jgi:hypothetical protein
MLLRFTFLVFLALLQIKFSVWRGYTIHAMLPYNPLRCFVSFHFPHNIIHVIVCLPRSTRGQYTLLNITFSFFDSQIHFLPQSKIILHIVAQQKNYSSLSYYSSKENTEYFDGTTTKLYNYHAAISKVLHYETRMYH